MEINIRTMHLIHWQHGDGNKNGRHRGIKVYNEEMKSCHIIYIFSCFLAQQAWTTQKRMQYGTSPFYTPPAQTTGMSDS
jgi:hypothetical protein